jgi:DNA-binding NtrC family response regulator
MEPTSACGAKIEVRTAELADSRNAWNGPVILSIEPPTGSTIRLPLPEDGVIEIGGAWAAAPSHDGWIGVEDPSVSARHARIELRAGVARIVDLGSRNGTWVGGARVEAAALPPGACALVGRTTLSIEVHAREQTVETATIPGAVGTSPAMRRLAAAVRAYAPLTSPVLVRGESGSGKEVVAQALHALSPRRTGPFQAVNLASLPRELAEAELFGHERGAFTGAAGARPGYFELAHGGTLFLDELGELPPELQPKLLRALESGEVRRLGARAPRKVDVRIVAATWAPLERRVEEGTFREDLYHRLAVLVIEVPPLRERRSDVPKLASTILASSADFAEKSLTPAAVTRLSAERWPGNVRELRNVVFRAAAFATTNVIDEDAVARALGTRPAASRPPRDPRRAADLVKTHGSIAAAARAAGVPRETLRDWVRSGR